MKFLNLRNTILLAMVAIITVTVLVSGFFSVRQFEEVLTERVIEDCTGMVSTIRQNMATLISCVEDYAVYLSVDDSLRDSITEYQEMTEDSRLKISYILNNQWNSMAGKLIAATDTIYNFEVYSGADKIYGYIDYGKSDKENCIPAEILGTALGRSSPVWSDLLKLTQYRLYNRKDEHGFAVVKSVRDVRGKIIGAIVLYIRESSFSEVLESGNNPDQSRFYLTGSENTIISANDKTLLYKDTAQTLGMTDDEYASLIANGTLMKTDHTDHNGLQILYIFKETGINGLKIISEIQLDDLYLQKRRMETFLWAVEIIAVLLAVVCARLITGRITRPMGKLMAIMEQMEQDGGKSHLRFPEGERGEIGVLGNRFNNLMDRLDASKTEVYQEQRQRRHNEVRLLQAQIIPHFLYNTLGIVSSFIKLGMNEKAQESIQNLSSFYRLSLSSGKEFIPISEEVELTRNYMELQKLRYIEYMEYTIEFDEDVKDIPVPKLTIQPLVENVLHHALRPTGEICTICVSVRADTVSDGIILTVYDNGTGIPAERLAQLRESIVSDKCITNSFGIVNIHQRLKLLYGENCHMEIDSEEGIYTEFRIFLPGNSGDDREEEN